MHVTEQMLTVKENVSLKDATEHFLSFFSVACVLIQHKRPCEFRMNTVEKINGVTPYLQRAKKDV